MVVYSEPSTHQEIVPVNRPWVVAVGVHPKNTDEFSSDRFLFIAELLNLPHTVALGDVRLDRTAPVNNKKQFIMSCQHLPARKRLSFFACVKLS